MFICLLKFFFSFTHLTFCILLFIVVPEPTVQVLGSDEEAEDGEGNSTIDLTEEEDDEVTKQIQPNTVR